ncbi:hypothetical protein [Nocardia sp. alder85J]|uniref:hypothetical protein n=1 Tax=Nocardia sp. alder85J TaxID=2862949 RepID=UPI001CD61CFE|nr:hypothetical protein [Nocardia sp. alder85J]MCX4096663.1 hypothetical protein [Nocardia sp. alder85J]
MTSHDEPQPVRFWPTGNDGTFESFYADDTPILRGDTTTLHWTCTNNPVVHYSLYYDTGGEDARPIAVDDAVLFQKVDPDDPDSPLKYAQPNPGDPGKLLDFAFPTEPLDGIAVGYHLQAVCKQQGVEETRDLTTATFVHRGDLKAGSINSLTGTAQLLTETQDGFANNTHYLALTDGFLCGAITGDRLWIQVSPPDPRTGGRAGMPSTWHLLVADTDSRGAYNDNLTIPIAKHSTLAFGLPDPQAYRLTWHPLGVGNLSDRSANTGAAPLRAHAAAARWPKDRPVEDFHPANLTVHVGDTTELRWHGPENSADSLFAYTLTYNVSSGPDTRTVSVDNDRIRAYGTADPGNDKLAYFTVPTEPLDGIGVGYHLRATYQPDGDTPAAVDLTTASVILGGDLRAGHLRVTGSSRMLHTGRTPLEPGVDYTAPTDGFIFGSVAGGTLRVEITPPGAANPVPPEGFTIASRSAEDRHGRDNENLTLPVRTGSEVTFTTTGDAGLRYKLSWHPLGPDDLAR